MVDVMRGKGLALLLALCMLVTSYPGEARAAEALPTELIRSMLLTTHWDTSCELDVCAYEVLGQKKDGRSWKIYLAALVASYGVMGGYLTEMSGWSGPCTAVLVKPGEYWQASDLLTVEDYSEIGEIMPENMKKKYLSGKYNQKRMGESISEQIASWRARTGREEPLGDYADAGGELAGIFVIASNLIPLAADSYPLGCTFVERLEDGERYRYTKAWFPDPGSEVNPKLEGPDGRMHEVTGQAGTVLMEKERVRDGEIMESITVHASLEACTMLYEDPYGKIRYTLPMMWQDMDGLSFPEYGQPQVETEGLCRMDTTPQEQYFASLPGKRVSEPSEEDTASVGEAERFVLLRDTSSHVLRHEMMEAGTWRADWENSNLIYPTGLSLQLTFDAAEDMLTISDAIGAGKIRITLVREPGGWMVRDAERASSVNCGTWLPTGLVMYGAPMERATSCVYLPGARDRRAEKVQTGDLLEAYWTLYDIMQEFLLERREKMVAASLADSYAERIVYLAACANVTLPVYSAPSKEAPRAAKGKAKVSLGDTVALLRREGDWLMILYEVSSGRYRTGWVDSGDHAVLREALPLVSEAAYLNSTTKVDRATELIDDPLTATGKLCSLKKGQEVRVLCASAALYYVEAKVSGKTWRGYVPSYCLKDGGVLK